MKLPFYIILPILIIASRSCNNSQNKTIDTTNIIVKRTGLSKDLCNRVIFYDLKEVVVDFDGNIYHTMKIGKQIWMKENLKVTHYKNGDSIIKLRNKSIEIQSFDRVGKYSDYYEKKRNSKENGNLYNWYVANDNRNVCPSGWHIPSSSEWSELANYLGDDTLKDKELKEVVLVGLPYWIVDDRQPFGGDVRHTCAFCCTLKYEGGSTGISAKESTYPLKCVKDSIK